MQPETASRMDQPGVSPAKGGNGREEVVYRPWMVVEKKFKRNTRSSNLNKAIFVGQEDSMGNGSSLQTKDNSSMPDLVDIQVVDPLGGLNPNRHTAVPFNKKGKAGGDHSKRTNVSVSGDNKFRNLGKSMGSKDRGFKATKKD
ncbi:hypothetical protein J1N35_003289 [Gossypium stocksii]|uniref:Uncharacterized protein n=1 Tax=Gossypium stocksii TaxID=47602 RepID=A0A9D4ANH0_9ROSI|nr:hypothetical protein J1N35_003289 [Gossypium stocksii]